MCAPLLKYNWLLDNNKKIENFYPIRFPTFEMSRWKTGELALYMGCLLGFKVVRYIAFDGGTECVHREVDGVSNIDLKKTQYRIQQLLDSFENIKINKFEDKVPCLATSGDTWAMYVMARREYDIARTTGDYSLAMEWAYKAREEKKVVVNRLLKMIYISLGKGLHNDPVESYVWLEEALSESEKNISIFFFSEN